MIAPAVALLLAAALPTLSVEQVVARHAALAGQTVRISGWLGRCEGLSCAMHQRPGLTDVGASIGLGQNHAFDRSVQGRTGTQITIEAIVKRSCWPDRGPDGRQPAPCIDRVGQVAPLRLVAEPQPY